MCVDIVNCLLFLSVEHWAHFCAKRKHEKIKWELWKPSSGSYCPWLWKLGFMLPLALAFNSPSPRYWRQSLYLPHRWRKAEKERREPLALRQLLGGCQYQRRQKERGFLSYFFVFVLRLWHCRNTAYYACLPAFNLYQIKPFLDTQSHFLFP